MINSVYFVTLKLMTHASELREQAAIALMEGNREGACEILARHNEAATLALAAQAQCEHEARIAALTN